MAGVNVLWEDGGMKDKRAVQVRYVLFEMMMMWASQFPFSLTVLVLPKGGRGQTCVTAKSGMVRQFIVHRMLEKYCPTHYLHYYYTVNDIIRK